MTQISIYPRPGRVGIVAFAAAAALLAGCAHQGVQHGSDHIGVKEIGSLHVGGRTATLSGLPAKEIKFTPTSPVTRIDPNGEYEVEQMYVQYVKLHDPYRRAQYPLLMIHGGGLAGVTWETKPDGGPSWQMFFLKHGHDVYIGDAVERGRASWARYPEICAPRCRQRCCPENARRSRTDRFSAPVRHTPPASAHHWSPSAARPVS